jgi:two-component system, cell cycle response regulator DivK
MAYAFNGHTLRQFISDAERLLASAREQEQELTSLAGLVAHERIGRTNWEGVVLATPTRAPFEVTNSVMVETVARLRVAAEEQRQFVETMIAGLLGQQTAGVARPRLLIVDDSDANRETTAAILEDAGYDVLTATNGLEGVIVAHYARPSVILMDLTMPVLNGLEAARLIRASAATQDLKVIAYTARPDLFDEVVAKWFADVILKPASPEAMVALIHRLSASEPRA